MLVQSYMRAQMFVASLAIQKRPPVAARALQSREIVVVLDRGRRAVVGPLLLPLLALVLPIPLRPTLPIPLTR